MPSRIRKLFQAYMVTNTETGAIFVAYTLNGVKSRKSNYFSTNSALYDDILKFGAGKFEKTVFAESRDKSEIKRAYRQKLDSLRRDSVILYNDMCAYGFVYMTTNLVNGMRYIGQHRITGDSHIDDGYLGSGIAISRAIRKYGKNSFRREILAECMTEDELNTKEKEIILEYGAASDSGFYNIAKGGDFGDTWEGRSSYKKRKFKDAIARSNRNRTRDAGKVSGENNPAYGRRWFKDIQDRKEYFLFPDDPMIGALGLVPGKFRTKAHNRKIGNAHRGKPKAYVVYAAGSRWMHKAGSDSAEDRVFIKESECEKYAAAGYVFGMKERQS